MTWKDQFVIAGASLGSISEKFRPEIKKLGSKLSLQSQNFVRTFTNQAGVNVRGPIRFCLLHGKSWRYCWSWDALKMTVHYSPWLHVSVEVFFHEDPARSAGAKRSTTMMFGFGATFVSQKTPKWDDWTGSKSSHSDATANLTSPWRQNETTSASCCRLLIGPDALTCTKNEFDFFCQWVLNCLLHSISTVATRGKNTVGEKLI